MAIELTYGILPPRILLKSRTGGILSRVLARTGLELVGAQMLAFEADEAREFGAMFCDWGADNRRELLGDYMQVNFAPAAGGKNPVLLLLFKGENAVERLKEVAGIWDEKPVNALLSGQTIFDTFGDQLPGIYFEPGIIVPETWGEARAELKFLAALAARSEKIISGSLGSKVSDERTLVMIKPEAWYQPSTRAGAIFDILSGAGLRLVGCKVLHLTVNMALEFYGQVQAVLRNKLTAKIGAQARQKLEQEFGFAMPPEVGAALEQQFGQAFADDQFYRIIKFMAGRTPAECPESERDLPTPGTQVLVLIFEGADAIARIRQVQGPTNPSTAPGGTVRGDYGIDVMRNAAHASDSPASVEREMRIIQIDRNTLADEITAYLGES